jgi:hypothetical protein
MPDFGYTIPAKQPTITVGQMLDVLTIFDRDLPITAVDDNDEYVNVVGASMSTEGQSLILETVDTFDTRQW